MQVAAEDYGGVTADEALGRLLDEHWEAKCIAAVARYRTEDPDGWAEYVRDADSQDMALSAAISDPWDETA
jgi:hypothetical protein